MLESEYQDGKLEVRVLLPDSYSTDKAYRVVYVLPVAVKKNWAAGFEQLKKMNAHNTYDLIVVGMQFAKEPWYGDHASDKRMRQAS